MDPGGMKHYHTVEMNSAQFFKTYFSPTSDPQILEELLIFPLKEIIAELGQGCIKGFTLIDFSAGPAIFHLLAICEYFSEITILEFNDMCMRDIQRWRNKENDALDWCHASKLVLELEGSCKKWEEKEDELRRRIKQILKCDFSKDNPTDPVVLQKADCVLSLYIMNFVCLDLDSYCVYLRKVSNMLKLGGHLLLFGGFDAVFYTVGKHKFHKLKFQEPFIRRALADTGFTIKTLNTIQSKVRNEVVEYGCVWFISAIKVKEP